MGIMHYENAFKEKHRFIDFNTIIHASNHTLIPVCSDAGKHTLIL